MKTSMQILSEIQNVLGRVRRLHGEAEANQPLRLNRRLNDAEERENERRRVNTDQITVEITSANAEAARLREVYAQALASERAPKPLESSPALKALYAKRVDLASHLDRARDARSKHALAAAEGDKKAIATLERAIDENMRGALDWQNLNLAIKQAEARDFEESLPSRCSPLLNSVEKIKTVW